jgi:hypothetical protein
MEKDIQLGPEAKGVLKLENGKIYMGVEYTGAQASANAGVSLDLEQYGQLLKDLIPGKVDDTVIDLLILALKSVG